MALMLSKSRIVPTKYNFMTTPVISAIGLIIVALIVGQIGYGKISEQNSQIKSLKSDITKLTTKESVLQKVEENVENQVDSVTMALPDSNPAIIVVSQLRGLAGEWMMLLDNITVSGESKDKQMNAATVNFDVDGDLTMMLSFMTRLETLSPIVKIQTLKISTSDEIARATASVRSYWSEYPTKLPAISEPVNELTEKQIGLMNQILQLKIPQFYTITPSSPVERADPFNL